MKKMKWVGLLCALVLLMGACGTSSTSNESKDQNSEAASAASGEQAGKALEDGTLDLGTNATFPPFESYDDAGKMTGIDIDIAQAVADELGYKLNMQDMEFDSIIAAIESGKLDGGIAGFTKTPEREKSVNFSTSYFQSVQLVIVKKDSPIQKIDELKGKKIGAQLGTTSQSMAEEEFGESSVQSFKAYQDAIMAMQSGKVDAVVCDQSTAMNFVNANADLRSLESKFSEEEYAMVLAKNNPALLEEVNGALKTLKDQGKLDEIFAKYKDQL